MIRLRAGNIQRWGLVPGGSSPTISPSARDVLVQPPLARWVGHVGAARQHRDRRPRLPPARPRGPRNRSRAPCPTRRPRRRPPARDRARGRPRPHPTSTAASRRRRSTHRHRAAAGRRARPAPPAARGRRAARRDTAGRGGRSRHQPGGRVGRPQRIGVQPADPRDDLLTQLAAQRARQRQVAERQQVGQPPPLVTCDLDRTRELAQQPRAPQARVARQRGHATPRSTSPTSWRRLSALSTSPGETASRTARSAIVRATRTTRSRPRALSRPRS